MKGEKLMEKIIYEEPKFELIALNNCDVIATSNTGNPFIGEDDLLEIT